MGYIPINVPAAVRKECVRRGYSERTIKAYTDCINKFIGFSEKTIDKLSKKDVLDFLYSLDEKNYSGSSKHVYLNAVRFLMEDILDKRMKLNIKYSRVPERLPSVLSKEEVKRLIGQIHNWKHRLMMEFIYGSGLRVSELISIRVKDLNLEKGFGFVRNGKGGKDRMIVLASIVVEKVRNLIEMEKLQKDDFVFLNNKREQYSPRSLQEIVKKASRLAGLNEKDIHCHTLRHSFATHLIEQGQSVSEVQSLLGHKSPETTFVYLHTATNQMINVKSPLDS